MDKTLHRNRRISTFHANSLIVALVLSHCVGISSAFAAGRVFYDGFESGNTSLWSNDSTRNPCQVVTSATDGVTGSFAGSRMLRCNDNGSVAWDSPSAYETLALPNVSYNKELFVRTRLRVDQNFQKTSGSPKKILRIFNWTGVTNLYNDLFSAVSTGSGLRNEGVAGGQTLGTYWGASDNTAGTSAWHKVEFYISTSGVIKVWHDGTLVRNDSGFPTGNAKWLPFTITSNWSDSHDSTNHIYFDEFEVFTDNGTGATGSMSSGTVSASGSPVPISAPTNLRVN
jgi:hypothetical protein